MVRLVSGVGVNDADYTLCKCAVIDGKRIPIWQCPYYTRWLDLIHRCYSKITQPAYVGCTVCEEWLTFSNFKSWVDSQPNENWQSCELDKDLLSLDNKLYSPDTCVFVDQQVNIFLTTRTLSRGKTMIGTCYHAKYRKFRGRCCNPFTGKQDHLGYFSTELEAHLAWKARKHKHACMLAEEQQDLRVAKALMERYAPDKDWTNK